MSIEQIRCQSTAYSQRYQNASNTHPKPVNRTAVNAVNKHTALDVRI